MESMVVSRRQDIYVAALKSFAYRLAKAALQKVLYPQQLDVELFFLLQFPQKTP